MLERKETDPNLALADGTTPLYIAAIQGYEDVVRELLKSDRVSRDIPSNFYKAIKDEPKEAHEAYKAGLELVQRIAQELIDENSKVGRGSKRKRGA